MWPVLVSAAWGCGSSSEPTGPGAGEPDTLIISTGSVTLDALGATQQVGVIVFDADGGVLLGVDVAWSSEDPGIATISGGGLVTAVSNGTTRITASAGAAVDHASVVVAQRPDTIVLSPPELTLGTPGDTVRLVWTVLDPRGGEMTTDVTVSTSDADVATVSPDGLVTATGQGSASLTAVAGRATTVLSVTVTGPLFAPLPTSGPFD